MAMGTEKIRKSAFWDGFFNFFGFNQLSDRKELLDIIEKDAATKIKSDIIKINKDYRRAYRKITNEIAVL